MATLSLISLNVEHERHLDTTRDFLADQHADVVCLQELREDDIPYFMAATQAVDFLFAPMVRTTLASGPRVMGLGIFSRLPIKKKRVLYYSGSETELPVASYSDPSTFGIKNCMVIACDVEKDGGVLRIATTHFTWTPDGNVDERQRRDMKTMLERLIDLDEFILAGDFNAPRGGEMFAALATKYKDNIPPRYLTSIDIALHRAGKERADQLSTKMVDGLFTTPAYTVSEVSLVSGVSDHMAIVASVSKI